MDQPRSGEGYSRSEKSLSTLTKKFVEMLQGEDILDLNIACSAMDVSKKRRIYDITNVLEGINLIKKVGKNLYSWTGKRDETNETELSVFSDLQEEAKLYAEEERGLDEAIVTAKRNVAAVEHNKSFCYLTKNDFTTAFADNAVLVIKHFKNIKLNFERELDSQFSSRTEVRDVLVTGDVHRPIQLQVVNAETNKKCDSNLLFCLDDMESDEDKSQQANVAKKSPKKRRAYPERSQNLALFRRRQKQKALLDLSDVEREKLAKTVLEFDKYKDKSMFDFIQEKHLVNDADYDDPDFIPIEQPVDSEYKENYSIEAPSVHDLFDLDVETLDYQYVTEDDYEMLEYIEDEDM